jgi:hypothetical protein
MVIHALAEDFYKYITEYYELPAKFNKVIISAKSDPDSILKRYKESNTDSPNSIKLPIMHMAQLVPKRQ